MRNVFKFSMIFAGAAFFCACSGDNPVTPATPEQPSTSGDKQLEIKIGPTIGDSRATDYAFQTGDRVGLFVVNYSGNTPDVLTATGNHVDNMPFTLSENGSWVPDMPIYWKDTETHADFYLYYPYSTINSVNATPFDLKANQSTESAYRACDFMIGKATNVAPTASVVSIATSHVMSQISILITPGDGFTAESLAATNLTVKINGLQTQSAINLSSREVTARGETTSVIPWKDGNNYRALIVPQTVAEGNLITVTADGREFNLHTGFTFETGKLYRFTVTLNKTSNGINVNINPWEDGGEFGGSAV